MHVKAKVAFYSEDTFTYGHRHLRLTVSFKPPGRFFNLSGHTELCTAARISRSGIKGLYKNEKEFLQDIVTTLKFPEKNIIPRAKELVMELLEEYEIKGEETDLKIKIDNLIKGNNKFEFDFDTNDEKTK